MAKIKYETAKEVQQQASMQEQKKTTTKTSKNLGRPKKTGEKADKKIMINVTKTQKEKIELYAEKSGLSVAGLIKSLLAKENIF